MRVLITGSNGLLGQKLVDRMCGFPELEVFATSLHSNVINYSSGYRFEKMDIASRLQCMEVIGRIQPDVIINTAAISHADICEENPHECDQINVEAVKYLVEAANFCGAHFIHLSTDFVFNGIDGPYTEYDTPEPINYYGKSKLKSEEWIVDNCRSWAVVRTVLVYGVNPNMSRSNLVLWVKNSLEEGKEIRVVKDQFRTPTLVEDLADGIFRIMNLKAQGVYHLSGEEMLSVYDIAVQIANCFDLPSLKILPIESQELNEKAPRPRRTGFVIDKSRTMLGFHPRSLEEGLRVVKEQLDNFKELLG